MPVVPYPLTGENIIDLRTQTANLFQDIYENGIGGAAVGDVFSVEGDVLTLGLYSSGGLEKTSNQLSLKLQDNSGLQLSSTGLAAQVAQTNLSTSSGSVGGSTGNYTLPGGEYGFYPQTKGTNFYGYMAYTLTSAPYVTNIYLNGTTPYAQQRYVTASGEVFWVFLLREKSTGEIMAGYQAPDHPCFGNGGDPLLVPHPFCDYNQTDHEIIVINPSGDEIKQIKAMCQPQCMGKPQKNLLELFVGKNPVVEINTKEEREYSGEQITVATVKDDDTRPMWVKEKIKIVKVKIPQPNYIKVHPIKRIRDARTSVPN